MLERRSHLDVHVMPDVPSSSLGADDIFIRVCLVLEHEDHHLLEQPVGPHLLGRRLVHILDAIPQPCSPMCTASSSRTSTHISSATG
jgi:hypothetical protein